MSTQVFRKILPTDILFSLLERICLKTDKYYLIDLNAYRKMLFYNYHTDFLNILREYYHIGKYNYIERKLTYNYFITIVRQICKASIIMYSSTIKYNESNYNINYMIYF